MITSRSQQTHEVREGSLPDAKLKLMHQVGRENLVTIKLRFYSCNPS